MMFEVFIDRDLEEVIPQFIENRKKDLLALKEAHLNGSFEKIRFIGHSLKGVGSGYGFDEVTHIGAKLEQSGKDGQAESSKELIEQLEYYLSHININFVDEE